MKCKTRRVRHRPGVGIRYRLRGARPLFGDAAFGVWLKYCNIIIDVATQVGAVETQVGVFAAQVTSTELTATKRKM